MLTCLCYIKRRFFLFMSLRSCAVLGAIMKKSLALKFYEVSLGKSIGKGNRC